VDKDFEYKSPQVMKVTCSYETPTFNSTYMLDEQWSITSQVLESVKGRYWAALSLALGEERYVADEQQGITYPS